MKKTGVLLIQLGTPDSASTSDVRRYLSEFLNDPRVIDLPYISRKLLVNGIIVPFRAPKSAKIYKELFDQFDGKSPLVIYTDLAVKALKERFSGNEHIDIEVAMRYQNPSMDHVLARMKEKKYDQLIIIPLFPQYASASSGSAIEKALSIIQKWWVIPEIKVVDQFYKHPGYIQSLADRARAFDISSYDHVLFSYHGLPERQVDKVHANSLCKDNDCLHEVNDSNQFCYKATSYETTRMLAQELGIDAKDYTVCFQSRLNDKWLMPFADKVIEDLAKQGKKNLLVFSPAFVADCLETILEIGTEYQEIFESHGGEKVQLVPSCNDHPRFIDCLEDLIQTRL